MNGELLRYKKHKRIVFDTETCHLNLYPKHNFPWSLAYAIVEDEKVVKESESYIWKEDLKISKEAAQITRFNFNEYKVKARPANEVYEEFAKYYYDPEYLIVGTNTYFDWHMVRCLEDYLGIKNNTDLNDRIYCTHALFKGLKLNLTPPKNKEDFVLFQFNLLNFVRKGLKSGIKASAEHFGIYYDPMVHHNALADVKYSNQIFNQLLWKMEIY